MEIKDFLLTGIWSAFLVILSASITFYFTNKSKKNEAMLKFKEEKYANLLILLKGFVGKTVSKEGKIKFLEEQYTSWLYASDGVVDAINQMIALLIEERGKTPDFKRGQKIIGTIVLEMRKDLLGKTKLTHEDFKYTDVVN